MTGSSDGELYIGTISGTSADGLDLAAVRVTAQTVTLCGSATVALPADLRERLITLMQPGRDEIDRLGAADHALGHFIGGAVLEFLSAQKIPLDQVAGIGSHGQTVRHRPEGARPFTLQIGDPNQIVEVTGLPTVADFRRRDMAAGGQGAPLVPPFHQAIFGDSREHRVVVNIGGIGNITILEPGSAVTGFDTGPGNALMDAWVHDQRGEPIDVDGAWAASGTLDAALLQRLLTDPYLQRQPPKSTGKEHYHLAWLENQLHGEPAADVQRTLAAFTAASISQAVDRFAPACERVIVCGGGRLNATLMADLARRLGSRRLDRAEDHGANGDAIEAAAFAWLASRTLSRLPGNAKGVTGASDERVLGGVYWP